MVFKKQKNKKKNVVHWERKPSGICMLEIGGGGSSQMPAEVYEDLQDFLSQPAPDHTQLLAASTTMGKVKNVLYNNQAVGE